MSRHFGRKQRRAALAQIGRLQTENNKFARSTVILLRDKRELQAKIELWDAEIRSLLGPYTSFAIEERTFR